MIPHLGAKDTEEKKRNFGIQQQAFRPKGLFPSFYPLPQSPQPNKAWKRKIKEEKTQEEDVESNGSNETTNLSVTTTFFSSVQLDLLKTNTAMTHEMHTR